MCRNTLIAGMGAATVDLTLNHTERLGRDAEIATRLVGQMGKAKETIMGTFRLMAECQINAADALYVIDAALPLPKEKRAKGMINSLAEYGVELTAADREFAVSLDKQYDQAKALVVASRAGVATLYQKFNDEFPATAGTAWAVYNAVCELADFRPGINEKRSAESALFGVRADSKRLAYDAAKTLIGAAN